MNWIERLHGAKYNKHFVDEAQDYKDGSGLQLTNFDFMTGRQEIKRSILVNF